MEAKDVVTALERFFLDIVGVVAPGTALLLGGWLMLGQPKPSLSVDVIAPWSWLVPLLAAYACGHALSSMGRKVLLPVAEILSRWLAHVPVLGRHLSWVEPEAHLFERVQNSKMFGAFVSRMGTRLPELQAENNPKENVRQWRNVAITIIQDQSQIVYRATFISAFNLGMATVCLLITALWLFERAFVQSSFSHLPHGAWSIAIVVAGLAFLERHYYFYSIAIRVPFAMALTQLELNPKKMEAREPNTQSS